MQIDYAAVAPELVLTGALCAVLVVDLVLPEDRKGLIMPVSLLGVAGTLVALLALAGGPVRTTLGGMFVVDPFAVTLKILFCVAALLTLAMSYDYLRRDEIHQGEFYFLLLCSLLGMLTIASSRDLLPIFVSLELVSVPAFVLAGLRKIDVKSNEAALKFFLFSILSTAVMLFGMSLIYGITGTTNLAEIALRLAATPVLRSIAVLSVFFVVVGFGFKISAFPFQWWVPDTYEGSPVPVAAFLSVASKTAGFVGLLQIMFIAFHGLADVWRPFIAAVAILTMTFGNLVALTQRHIVRLLAYSSIGQAGYILLPLAVVNVNGGSVNHEAFAASIAYLLIYAFMEMGAFSVAVAYGREGGYFIDDYAGLGSRAPGLAVVMTVFLFSLAGVPPLAGWAAKLFIFRAVIDGHEYWLAAAMAVNTVIALFYYAKVVRRMFFEPAGDGPLDIKVPLLLQATIAVSTVMVLVIGILPDLAGHLAKMSTLV